MGLSTPGGVLSTLHQHLTYSAIHKATVQPATIQNALQRPFCMAASFDILGIIPGK